MNPIEISKAINKRINFNTLFIFLPPSTDIDIERQATHRQCIMSQHRMSSSTKKASPRGSYPNLCAAKAWKWLMREPASHLPKVRLLFQRSCRRSRLRISPAVIRTKIPNKRLLRQRSCRPQATEDCLLVPRRIAHIFSSNIVIWQQILSAAIFLFGK